MLDARPRLERRCPPLHDRPVGRAARGAGGRQPRGRKGERGTSGMGTRSVARRRSRAHIARGRGQGFEQSFRAFSLECLSTSKLSPSMLFTRLHLVASGQLEGNLGPILADSSIHRVRVSEIIADLVYIYSARQSSTIVSHVPSSTKRATWSPQARTWTNINEHRLKNGPPQLFTLEAAALRADETPVRAERGRRGEKCYDKFLR